MEPVTRQESDFTARVGLEVHAQLSTRTKLFCACRTDYGAEPNSQTCPVCLGLPGALPVLNDTAVDYAVRVAVALGGKVAPCSYFARKNYFYPDVPKNYQITQYDRPLMTGGRLDFDVAAALRRLNLIRMHLEEDAGKLLHDTEPPRTRVDLNRAGVPLLEIVTAPELCNGHEARACVEELRRILLYLKVCDGNLQEGSLRCDANVSVHRVLPAEKKRGDPGPVPVGGQPQPLAGGLKIEIKNLNSFRAIQQAVDHEIARQTAALNRGEQLRLETRGWDAELERTYFMRSKEQVHDYRYFPDPDLPPLIIAEREIAAARDRQPELPEAKRNRYVAAFALPPADVEILTGNPALAAYFEATVAAIAESRPDTAATPAESDGAGPGRQDDAPEAMSGGLDQARQDARLAAGWILTELLAELNRRDLDVAEFPVSPQELARLLILRQDDTLSSTAAKEVFAEMVISGRTAADIVQRDAWQLIADREELTCIVNNVLRRHADAVQSFLNGKERVFTFLVGQIMQATGGRAHPETAREVLQGELARLREGKDRT